MFRYIIRKRVIVNLRSGNAVQGVLLRKSFNLLFLRDCTLHSIGADPSPVDGEIVVERSNVDFIQAF